MKEAIGQLGYPLVCHRVKLTLYKISKDYEQRAKLSFAGNWGTPRTTKRGSEQFALGA